MNSKDDLKNKFKNIKIELDVSTDCSNLFESLEKQYESEIENNVTLKFKKNLRNNLKQIKENKDLSLFIPEEKQIQEEVEKEVSNPEIDLIQSAVSSITKTEQGKPKNEFSENYINLMSQPNSELVGKDINLIQRKLKSLEDWVSKISLAGSGSGEVRLLRLDDVDTSNLTDAYFLQYNASTKKMEFVPAPEAPEGVDTLDFVTTQGNTTNNSIGVHAVTFGDGTTQNTAFPGYNTVLVSSNNYTSTSSDYYIGVNHSGPTTINLPSTNNGNIRIIKDESGNASIYPITISGNIDNSSNAIMQINNGSITLIYRNGWRII